MSDPGRLPDYLRQMTQGAPEALAFTEGMDRDEFGADLRTQRAVVMSLMIVGEPASRVLTEYPAFAAENPGIAWRGIRGHAKPDRAWLFRHRPVGGLADGEI